MTTPTKAAMRAAEAIIDGITIVEDERQEFAMTIDLATDLPELVACLREARESLANAGAMWIRSIIHDTIAEREGSEIKHRAEIDRIHARIDSALARVDSPEPVR